jgi:hypothetical protein
MQTTEKTKQMTPESEIREGEGRFPWWVWIAIVTWLVYAFLIGPFHITGPQG